MAKKNRNNSLKRKEVQLCDGTILEQFEDYISKHKKVSDIITFLSVKNAELIGLSGMGKIGVSLKDELYEFYDYFFENFDELTAEARIREWGQEPFIFRLTEEIMHQEEEQLKKAFLDSLSDHVKKEAKTLSDTLFAIRENRILTIVNAEEYYSFEIPKVIYREELGEYREDLFFLCCTMIANLGAMTVRLIKKQGTEIFGIRTLPIGVWSPISKEEMRKAHTTAPNGIELEPEDGVIYTEIMREKF